MEKSVNLKIKSATELKTIIKLFCFHLLIFPLFVFAADTDAIENSAYVGLVETCPFYGNLNEEQSRLITGMKHFADEYQKNCPSSPSNSDKTFLGAVNELNEYLTTSNSAFSSDGRLPNPSLDGIKLNCANYRRLLSQERSIAIGRVKNKLFENLPVRYSSCKDIECIDKDYLSSLVGARSNCEATAKIAVRESLEKTIKAFTGILNSSQNVECLKKTSTEVSLSLANNLAGVASQFGLATQLVSGIVSAVIGVINNKNKTANDYNKYLADSRNNQNNMCLWYHLQNQNLQCQGRKNDKIKIENPIKSTLFCDQYLGVGRFDKSYVGIRQVLDEINKLNFSNDSGGPSKPVLVSQSQFNFNETVLNDNLVKLQKLFENKIRVKEKENTKTVTVREHLEEVLKSIETLKNGNDINIQKNKLKNLLLTYDAISTKNSQNVALDIHDQNNLNKYIKGLNISLLLKTHWKINSIVPSIDSAKKESSDSQYDVAELIESKVEEMNLIGAQGVDRTLITAANFMQTQWQEKSLKYLNDLNQTMKDSLEKGTVQQKIKDSIEVAKICFLSQSLFVTHIESDQRTTGNVFRNIKKDGPPHDFIQICNQFKCLETDQNNLYFNFNSDSNDTQKAENFAKYQCENLDQFDTVEKAINKKLQEQNKICNN